MLEREKLEELFRDTLAKIKEEKGLPLFPVSFRSTYSTVFSGSASKIGCLDPELLNRLVRYYYKIQTLVELGDIFSSTLEDIYERGAEEDSEEIAEQVETLEDMIKTVKQARSEAIHLVNDLDPPSD